MFVRSRSNLPKDPHYPADLEQLGYKLNDQGEFVKINEPEGPNRHFLFFVTDNERANETHKEAMHIAVREKVEQEMAVYGVKALFLGGEDGSDILGYEHPNGKHMTIRATELEVLKEKKDVIVVVGEHNQDPGIWAWRSVLGEGGINGGTAVGMVKQLQTLGLSCDSPNKRTLSFETKMSYEDKVREYGLPSKEELAKEKSGADEEGALMENMPGIIILNPGQLIHSNQYGECMTWLTWKARIRDNALVPPHRVHEEYNRVLGHTNPEEHIATVFDKVIPQMVRQDAKLYVIGITDGAEKFINWYDAHTGETDPATAEQVWAMAFMEPMHEVNNVVNERTKSFLHSKARSWIKSSRPLGKFINSADALNKIPSPEGDKPTSSVASDTSNISDELPEMRAVLKSVEQFKIEEEAAAAETGDDDDIPDHMKDSYDFTTRFVSCPTFSGGEAEIDELLLVKAMTEVLAWFVFRAEEPY